jgi:hypothetical protein
MPTAVLFQTRISRAAARRSLANTWLYAAAVAAVVVLTAVSFVAVRATGGSPNALNHLGYLPVILAAYLFGLRGGAFTALVVSIVLGPLAAWLTLAGGVEGPTQWTQRAAIFILVGSLMGVLFDRFRRAAEGWQSAAIRVVESHRDAMVALARGAEAKDTDTGDHVVRVQFLAEELASKAGMAQEQAAEIGWSAMLHDVGKLHVPDRILLKPGPLTAKDWQIISMHPIWGAQILAQGEGFELARKIARWHHEDFDGSGYPDRLAGDRIPLEARIVRIADAYDAMTHTRPYQPARSPEWALEELRRCAGRQFDPELIELMLRMLEDPDFATRLVRHRLPDPLVTIAPADAPASQPLAS